MQISGSIYEAVCVDEHRSRTLRCPLLSPFRANPIFGCFGPSRARPSQNGTCGDFTEMCSGSGAGSYLRRTDSCITQLKAQGPCRTCNESKEEYTVTMVVSIRNKRIFISLDASHERRVPSLGLFFQFYHCRFYQLGPDNSCYRTYQVRADNLGPLTLEFSCALNVRTRTLL